MDLNAAKAAILERLNLLEEFKSLGIAVTGRVREGGFAECKMRADDRNPSGWINIETGRWGDSGEGTEGSFWDLALSRRSGTIRDVLKHYAAQAGVDLRQFGQPGGKGKTGGTAKQAPAKKKAKPADPDAPRPWEDKLELLDWIEGRELQVRRWCEHVKPGVTLEAIQAAGGRIARYYSRGREKKDEYPSQVVIAIPAWQANDTDGPPISWSIWKLNGGNGGQFGKYKMLNVGPSRGAIMGRHALDRLAGESVVVWKCAGPADMLATWAAIPPELRDRHLVISNADGEDKWPSAAAVELLTGKDVVIMNDCDDAGALGSRKWREKLKDAAFVRRFILPFEHRASHGKDARDFFNEGGTFAQLCELLKQPHRFDGYHKGNRCGGAWDEEAEASWRKDKDQTKDYGDQPAPDASEPAVTSPAGPEADDVFEQQIVNKLCLDVLGEVRGDHCYCFSLHYKKIVRIPDIDRLKYSKLLQYCGSPAKRYVVDSGDAPQGMFTLREVRQAIAYLAGKRRIDDGSLTGLGVWPGIDGKRNLDGSIVLVGSSEGASIRDGTIERLDSPRCGGRILELKSNDEEDWFDFELLNGYLRDYSHKWAESVIMEAVELFKRWRWRYQETSPRVLVGLILATWVQTVWAWRPQIEVTGASNTGKSTLFKVLEGIFGSLSEASSKSSAAGLRQTISRTSKIMLNDEFEKSKHRAEILEMVRAASRGDKILMGQSNQDAKRFIVQHMFWIGAIETGLLRAADRNRFISLELVQPKEEDAGKLEEPSRNYLFDLGQKLLAIAVRCAADARLLAVEMKSHKPTDEKGKPLKVDQRVVESYSVPVAMLSTAVGVTIEQSREPLNTFLRTVSEEDQRVSDEEDLMQTILRSVIRLGPNEERTVADLIQTTEGYCRDALERNGIGITKEGAGRTPNSTEAERDDFFLFIDHKDVTSKLLYKTTGDEWRGKSIDKILKRIPEAKMKRARIGGRRVMGVWVPMTYILNNFFHEPSPAKNDSPREKKPENAQPDFQDASF